VRPARGELRVVASSSPKRESEGFKVGRAFFFGGPSGSFPFPFSGDGLVVGMVEEEEVAEGGAKFEVVGRKGS